MDSVSFRNASFFRQAKKKANKGTAIIIKIKIMPMLSPAENLSGAPKKPIKDKNKAEKYQKNIEATRRRAHIRFSPPAAEYIFLAKTADTTKKQCRILFYKLLSLFMTFTF